VGSQFVFNVIIISLVFDKALAVLECSFKVLGVDKHVIRAWHLLVEFELDPTLFILEVVN